jgi:hypothetical protein
MQGLYSIVTSPRVRLCHSLLYCVGPSNTTCPRQRASASGRSRQGPSVPPAVYVMSAAQIADLESVVQRVAGLVVNASDVADRSEHLPCLDHWATKERLARLDDVVLAGRNLLVWLGQDWEATEASRA